MPPDESNTANCLQPGLEAMKGEKHRRAHILCDDANGLAWLPWQSCGCEHGLKRHKIAKSGYVYETCDRPTEPRRKPKAVSSRQWRAE